MRSFVLAAALLASLPLAAPAPAAAVDEPRVIRPGLPAPDLSENAKASDFLRAALGAVAAGRKGQAEESLEMAQTRLLDRSVPLGRTHELSGDPAVGQISIDIGGKRLVDNHGPTEATQFQWPGPDGQTAVRVTMTPANGGNADIKDFTGPWALLRMLDAAKITPSSEPDQFKIQFTGGGGIASFALTASSVRNPFNLAALRSFRCPAKL